jgi:type IV pilus assembly protein PilA
MFKLKNRMGRKGFTLVELAVVIVIIGVLASFGVPKFMASVERSKAAEAFNFLSALQAAEERYQALTGGYTADFTQLDISWKSNAGVPVLQYFTYVAPTVVAGTQVGGTVATTTSNTWSCTLTRAGGSGDYASYTVTYTQDGFDFSTASGAIPAAISPVTFPTVVTTGS